MKNSLMILLCLFISYTATAQEKEKQKEIGLIFSNLDNFGLSYKTGTNKSLWRFNTLLLSGKNTEDTRDDMIIKENNLGFNIRMGREYRKIIVDDVELRIGADLSFSYSQSTSNYDDKTANNYEQIQEVTNYRPGFNLVFGFNYMLSNNIVIGAELLPGFNYISGESVETTHNGNNTEIIKSDISGFSYGFSNTSALLSIACRF